MATTSKIKTWLSLTSKHAAQAPQIQRIIIVLQVYEQLWSLEVARSHPDIVPVRTNVGFVSCLVKETMTERVMNMYSSIMRAHALEHMLASPVKGLTPCQDGRILQGPNR